MQDNSRAPRTFRVNNQGDIKIEDTHTSNSLPSTFISNSNDLTTTLIPVIFPRRTSIRPAGGGSGSIPFARTNNALRFTRVRWDNSIPTDPTATGLTGNQKVGIPAHSSMWLLRPEHRRHASYIGTAPIHKSYATIPTITTTSHGSTDGTSSPSAYRRPGFSRTILTF